MQTGLYVDVLPDPLPFIPFVFFASFAVNNPDSDLLAPKCRRRSRGFGAATAGNGG